ncbi:MAG: tRNA pseudouridine(55) synthase TruB [Eggerthellaceae bacterium]|nr:tRNA pseudouridine(55) synthase TruB [Eggerthellaceae bacterium]
MKRGDSGLSLVVAVDKPRGMSSHDVVNRVRRIFGERRVGHTGTLDPLATGVLPICIGPAAKLDRFMTAHDKRYRVTISFGFETNTDDSEGEPTEYGIVSEDLYDSEFARATIEAMIGEHDQVPPAYSAIKVDGKRAYQLARSGKAQELEPRRIEVYDALLVSVEEGPDEVGVFWTVDFSVSKGTYIRALARDLGRSLGCPAHVSALQRIQAGNVKLDDCVSLETLETLGLDAAIDPVAIVGLRFAFADDYERLVENGSTLPNTLNPLYEAPYSAAEDKYCACTGSLVVSNEEPHDGELVCMVVGNRLKAIYMYSSDRGLYKPECVFSVGVIRG